jgi:hypothetical protein
MPSTGTAQERPKAPGNFIREKQERWRALAKEFDIPAPMMMLRGPETAKSGKCQNRR